MLLWFQSVAHGTWPPSQEREPLHQVAEMSSVHDKVAARIPVASLSETTGNMTAPSGP